MKTSPEIRKDFLDFFASKGHAVVPSASLVPDNDPTLLFTNAGMNQFKDVFLGAGKRDYTRAADTQKCMRVSGKHNDLDDVGKDTYHHTFFEMLGNWSFGDYYKKEAITWAWELFTKVWGLDKSKLYATVYKEDSEAEGLWKYETDIDPAHVMRFGEKENFWEMGETGPCGPCSEIHIDLGANACNHKGEPGHKCEVNGNCSRYIELWNLVFIQYNREADKSLKPLPAKHVDTGMGFERIVSVLQGKTSNYDSDVFTPVIGEVEKLSGVKYATATGMPHRVVADHIRSLTFALADGVMPSNEGRGYVMRKILRRAARYGKVLGFSEPFLYKLADIVIDTMGHQFPEIVTRREMVKGLILSEETSFFKTLNRGMDKLQEIVAAVKKSGSGVISGDDVFLLYDSMGFPIDFTQQVAKDENLAIDMDRFAVLMNEQKERARANWKGFAFDFSVIKGKAKPTAFLYDTLARDGKIELLVSGNKLVDKVSAGDDVVVITSETPFYGEKGGQVGDEGVIEKDGGIINVHDTKIYDDVILHIGKVEKGEFAKGDAAAFRVDEDRRAAIARNHTATHLIHRALHEVVGEHAVQAGSMVSPDRLRFDFTHGKALTREQIETIENKVNAVVVKNLPVVTTCMNQDEAKKTGAMAIFEEKYGDVVRVVEVSGFSKELCGGTHVKHSGEIGAVKIVSEGSISAGTRRLEAVTGLNAFADYRVHYNRSKELADILKVDDAAVPERVRQLGDEIRKLEKQIDAMKRESAASGVDTLLAEAKDVNGSKVVVARMDVDADTMTAVCEAVKAKGSALSPSKGGESVVFLIGESNGKVALTVSVTKGLTAKVKAGDVARETAKLVGGGGGGRPDFAQAGGKDINGIDAAMKKAREMIEGALK